MNLSKRCELVEGPVQGYMRHSKRRKRGFFEKKLVRGKINCEPILRGGKGDTLKSKRSAKWKDDRDPLLVGNRNIIDPGNGQS